MKIPQHRYFSFMCIFSSCESPADGHSRDKGT